MYQALLVVDPTDRVNMSMMGIYAQKRDADKYFEMVAAVLPGGKKPALDVSLGMYNSKHVMTAADFSGGYYAVLEAVYILVKGLCAAVAAGNECLDYRTQVAVPCLRRACRRQSGQSVGLNGFDRCQR